MIENVRGYSADQVIVDEPRGTVYAPPYRPDADLSRVPVVPGANLYRSYSSVWVPQNSSSIPGVEDKTDPGWLPVRLALASILMADFALAAALAWYLR